MKGFLFGLILIIGISINTSAQKTFKDDVYGFSMLEPKDWLIADNQLRLANLNKVELSDETRTKLINESKGQLLLTSYYKYDQKKHAGLIPTIQVNIRNNPTKTFEQFSSAMMQSANGFKNYFADFKFLKEPEVIEINGVKAVYFTGTYTLATAEGVPMKVRSRTYAIPSGFYFFQLNFTDENGNENDTKLFDNLVQSIRITK